MVFPTIIEPFFQVRRLMIAQLPEQLQAGLIPGIDHGLELMQVKNFKRIFSQYLHRTETIALSAERLFDDQSDFRPTVASVEIHNVGNAYHLTLRILDNQPHLMVGIDVACGIGHIVMKGITAIGDIGDTDIPEIHIVLDAIEQVEVFGFNGP